ncbi:MAG: hypothetical protein E7K14_01500 [Bacillota bacterium]|nr:hypothetical protein [Bacillota bacterium]
MAKDYNAKMNKKTEEIEKLKAKIVKNNEAIAAAKNSNKELSKKLKKAERELADIRKEEISAMLAGKDIDEIQKVLDTVSSKEAEKAEDAQ